MSVFRDHKIGASQLLDVIPAVLFSGLSATSKVDHYAKVLHGKKMFYLLLYGILENEKLSQRTLEDTFNDPVFKTLFSLDKEEKVRRSSISERLSKIDTDYFKQIYDCIYEQFSNTYSPSEKTKHNLIRVDSTMISESVGKLMEGIDNKSGKNAVKYSIAFDGLLPCAFDVFTKPTYSSEDIALPEVITQHVKKESNHKNIYVVDRGLQSTKTMKGFTEDSIKFICRAKENRKFVELKSLMRKNQNLDLGESTLIKDCKVQLYTGTPIKNKRGNTHYKEELIETPFRLVIAQRESEQDKQYWFLTNDFKLSAKQIAQAYRRRWDIEVFFRFLKQELNVSHLVSLNKNGITVLLYMTLIVAMLVLIYKKLNGIGYKTAKRRLFMEVRNLSIAIIVEQCGGDPGLLFKT